MTPAEIKKTRLYRTLAPCVRKEDREELARMLAMVPESAYIRHMSRGMNCNYLRDAFWWDESPQEIEYWSLLSDRLRFAGHACY